MQTVFSPTRGALLFGVLVIYYIWLFVGMGKSGENSLNPERLIDRLDHVGLDHFESGAHDTKLQVHPFDGPQARNIKDQLHGKTSEVHDAVGPARGAKLPHSWVDDQLFQAAIKSDRRAQHLLASGGHSIAGLVKKIAFMFLVERDLPLEPLWAKFLQGKRDRYNVYVHLNPFQPSILKGVFLGRDIPSMVVEPNTPGFIAAARRLLASAILDDPLNEWFALMSDACLPLHRFDYIFKTLESTNKSFVEINSKKFPLLWYRYIARGIHSLEPEVSWADFTMGSKWWIMRKRHAKIFLEDRMYWNKFSRPCLPEHKMCFPEEHYFSTVLSLLDKKGSTGKAVTFQNDRAGLRSDRPKTFRCKQINDTFFSNLQRKDKGQWLFAQRFSAICLEKLLTTTRKTYFTQKVQIA